MSGFEKAMGTLGMNGMSSTSEIDISNSLDKQSEEFIKCITSFLGDVVIIRCTHKTLSDWTKGRVFIEVITDTDHDSDFATVCDIVEEFFGKCAIEPTSDIMVCSSDNNIVMCINESCIEKEYSCIYRR